MINVENGGFLPVFDAEDDLGGVEEDFDEPVVVLTVGDPEVAVSVKVSWSDGFADTRQMTIAATTITRPMTIAVAWFVFIGPYYTPKVKPPAIRRLHELRIACV